MNNTDRENCRSRDWCKGLIGSGVSPIENTDSGKVLSFSYRGGHVTEHHASWKVKYYLGQRRNAVATKEYSYWQLKDIIVPFQS